MSHLLDTDICSAHLKRPAGLMHRFIQHSGGLYISSIALGELYTWAYHRHSSTPLLDENENDLLADVTIVDYDKKCCEEFGRVRGTLLRQGISVSRLDLMIAAVALAN